MRTSNIRHATYRASQFRTPPFKHASLALQMGLCLLGMTGMAAHAVEAEQPVASGAQAVPDSATATLKTVKVKAAGYEDAATEKTKSYTVKSMETATPLSLPIREIPQSVSVITRQMLDDRGVVSVTDALSNTTGIFVERYASDRARFFSRGFEIESFQYDGIPTRNDHSYSGGEEELDSIIYDRIEIVRGATGLLTGAGEPSASINLIRKHADSREFAGEINVSAGSWDDYRSSVDLSGPLNSEGTVRGRVIGSYQERDSFLDNYHKRKKLVYGVIDADLSEKTTLSIGGHYQENTPRGSLWGGLPMWFSDGTRTDWSRSTSTAAKWSSWGTDTSTAFATLTHTFDSEWKLRANYTYGNNDFDAKLLFLYDYPDRETGLGLNADPEIFSGYRKQNSVDVNLSGNYSMFGKANEIAIGFAQNKQKGVYEVRFGENFADVGNFFAWDGSYPEPVWGEAFSSGEFTTKQTALYAANRIALTDSLNFILGARLSNWETEALGYMGNSYDEYDHNNELTPYAGLTYDINETYSAYASYTSIFNPQSERDRNGKYLDPTTGNSYEAGLKAALLNGRLNATFAAFQTKQDDLAQEDGDYLVPGTSDQAYFAAEGVTVQGVEMDISGEIAEGWSTSFGWTRYSAKDADGRDVNSDQARTLVRLMTSYRLPGQWQSLVVGGGINWQGKIYTLDDGPLGEERVEQGAYALTHLFARYAFTPQLSAQLNIDNLTDKKYYSQIGFYGQGAYGEPRSTTLSVSYKFK